MDLWIKIKMRCLSTLKKEQVIKVMFLYKNITMNQCNKYPICTVLIF